MEKLGPSFLFQLSDAAVTAVNIGQVKHGEYCTVEKGERMLYTKFCCTFNGLDAVTCTKHKTQEKGFCFAGVEFACPWQKGGEPRGD